MSANQEIYINFTNLPSINIIEGSQNPVAQGDEISDSVTFNYSHGDLTIAGDMGITANKKLVYRMDYAIAESIEFCIEINDAGYESFTVSDSCLFKPIIHKGALTHLTIIKSDVLAATFFQLERHRSAPFLDLESCSVKDPIEPIGEL